MAAAVVADAPSPHAQPPPTAARFTYTACYCEENVYLLLRQLSHAAATTADGQLFAVFISNASETVPFWYQRASQHPDGFCVWDYHVIALQIPGSSSSRQPPLVWDLDLQHPQLSCPCTLEQYAQHALQAATYQLPPHLQRMFRLVPADSFLRCFASDRSHMRRADGSWSAAPPQYACITAADGSSCSMNLPRYRDMAQDVLQVNWVDQQQQQQQQEQLGRIQQQQHEQEQLQAHHLSSSSRLLAWQDVVAAAGRSKYGVVVHEHTLLRCLLGGDSACN